MRKMYLTKFRYFINPKFKVWIDYQKFTYANDLNEAEKLVEHFAFKCLKAYKLTILRTEQI